MRPKTAEVTNTACALNIVVTSPISPYAKDAEHRTTTQMHQ